MTLRTAITDMLHLLAMSRAVRIGAGVFLISIAALVAVELLDPMAVCNGLLELQRIAQEHRMLAYAILLCWSFLLFLTVMPLGTLTILMAGFLLGPAAGGVQFVALVLSSAILYKLGSESDPAAVNRRFAAYPVLAKVRDKSVRGGKWVSAGLRLVPVVPSAVASLMASFLGITWRDFMIGTIAAGWVRPVAFAFVGFGGQFAPVCGIGSV